MKRDLPIFEQAIEFERRLANLRIPGLNQPYSLDFNKVLSGIDSTESIARALQQIGEQSRLAAEMFPLHSVQIALDSLRSPIPSNIGVNLAAFTSHLESVRKLTETLALRTDTPLLGQLTLDGQWRNALEGLELNIGKIEALNLEVPQLALEGWPIETIGSRLALIEDSIKNVAALREVQAIAALDATDIPLGVERIGASGELVWNHGLFVRSIPPALPRAERPTAGNRSEELPSKLESKLREVDPHLVDLRSQAWKNFANGKSGARLAAHGIREVFSEVLRRFAPEDQVKKSEVWERRLNKDEERITRRMRFEYIVGPNAEGLAAVLQFDESVTEANKFAHIFADNVELVRAHLAQLEACIYLMLTFALETENSSKED